MFVTHPQEFAGTNSQPLNLLANAWIPIRRASGRIETIAPSGLTDRINSDPVVAIASSRPDFDRAMLEFLIGLLATACPPIDTADWVARYRRPPTPDELAVAFAPLTEAFGLDGAGSRFMQDVETFEADEIPIAQLLIGMPGENTLENNTDHFVKRGQIQILCRRAAAMALHALQTYAPSGGSGHRTSVRGGGPLTTLIAPEVRGDRPAPLWSTLWANVPDYPAPSRISVDVFPWLGPTRVSDNDQSITPQDVDPLQAFWGTPRRIRLVFAPNSDRLSCDLTGEIDDIVVTGFRMRPGGANYAAWVHPLSPYYRPQATKKVPNPGLLPVHGQLGGIGWRDYLGLVVNNDEPEKTFQIPAACVTLFRQNRGTRVSEDEWGRPQFRILAFGYDTVNMKARGWTEGGMPLWVPPDAALLAPLDDFVRALVNGADIVCSAVTRAVKSALLGERGGSGRTWSRIAERVWAESEVEFHAALGGFTAILRLPEDERADRTAATYKVFFDKLKRLAYRIFDDEVSIDTLADAGLRAIRNSRRGLTRIVHPVVEARKTLSFILAGYRAEGQRLYGVFGFASSEPAKAKTKGKKS